MHLKERNNIAVKIKFLIVFSVIFLLFSFAAAFAQTGQSKIESAAPGKLPKPTGSFVVGTKIFHLTDFKRPDSISKKPGQFRELMVQAWYPAASAYKGEKAAYLPDQPILQAFLKEQYDLQSEAVLKSLAAVSTDAFLNAPLSNKQSKYPVLIFSHGLGEPRSNYTSLAEDLASRGYIVFTVDHPYGGFTILPDGRVLTTADDDRGGNDEGVGALVEEWAKDAAFIIDQFNSRKMSPLAGHLSFEKIGMLGHSLGGAAALEACRTDLRFKACADLDGAPFGKIREEGIKKPTLVLRNAPIYSDKDLAKKGRTRAQWEEMGKKGKLMWDTILPKDKQTPLYIIRIAGTGHSSFSDGPFVMPDVITRFGGKIIDPYRGFEIISGYVGGFFDKYLNGKNGKLLDAVNSPYPEALIEKINLRHILPLVQ